MSYIGRLTIAQLCFLAIACASPDSGNPDPLSSAPSTLDLYAEAYAAGQHGFSCLPATQVGGPARSSFLRLQRRLEKRRLAVRDQLVRKYGAAELDAIELRFFEELETVHFVAPCQYAVEERRKFRRRLGRLEKVISSGAF